MTGRFSPFVVLLAILALVDFLTVPFVAWTMHGGIETQWGKAVAVGAFLSQFGILPAWLVWGRHPFWQRTIIHWFSATGLLLAFVLGLFCTEIGSIIGPFVTFPYGEIVAGAFVLPAISLAVEGPLWLTRFLFGWRLVPPGVVLEPERKLAIRDFLVGMSVVAVALTAARLSTTLAGSVPDIHFWGALAIAAASAAVASAAALPLIAWALLRLDRWPRGLVIVGIYGVTVGSLLALVLYFVLQPPTFLLPFVSTLLLAGTFAAAIAGSFLLARRAGYRLQTGGRHAPVEEA